MSEPNSLDMLELRLARLERRMRTYHRSLMLVGAVLGLGVLLYGQADQDRLLDRFGIEGQAPQGRVAEPPLVVRDSITLVDSSGTERALLTTIDDGTSLVLFDNAGVPRVVLTSGYRTSLALYDGTSQLRAVLGATSSVPSHVERADGTIERSPVSSLVLFDEEGNLVERAP